ncbi:MAG: extracellular solute-binding protein [Treponema sp.]|nr:extracellular solute-binding protein [Treponema sp.]
MKIVKKAAVLALFLLIGAGLVFAGGGAQPQGGAAKPQGGAAAASSGPEKVYFYAWTVEANMVPLLDAFNKQYAGKYEMVYKKLANAQTMIINTALSSGDPITVMTQSSAIDLRQRADAGTYMGLKKFFDKEKLTYAGVFGDSIEQTQNIKGDYYSLPYCNNINVVFYNKKMFDAAKVPYPADNWTWADFRETAKKLTSGSGANKVYGAMLDVAGGAPGGDNYWASIAQQKLGTFWYYNKDFKSTRFDAPEMKESLQFFSDMVMGDKTCVPLEEYMALRYSDDIVGMNGLYSGKYAMWVAPVYGCLYLTKPYGELPPGTDIGMANFPRPVGAANSSSVTYTSTASIPANAKNPDAAWTTIKYICIDHAELFAGPKAMHPGYAFKTVDDANKFNSIIFTGKPGLDYNMAMRVMALPRTLISRDMTIIQGQAKINDLITADLTMVFNGEMTVDAALKDLKTKGDQYIAADLK